MAKKPETESLLPEAPPAAPQAKVEEPQLWLTSDVERQLEGMKAEDRAAYIEEVERIRSTRKGAFGSYQQKLALEKRPGYYTHWFNDFPGRIDAALENGWTYRKDKEAKPTRRVVGTARDGGPQFAYAMDIPNIFHEEDMAVRHKMATERLDDIQKNPIRAPAGVAKASDRGKFYSPVEEGVVQVRETLRRERRPASA